MRRSFHTSINFYSSNLILSCIITGGKRSMDYIMDYITYQHTQTAAVIRIPRLCVGRIHTSYNEGYMYTTHSSLRLSHRYFIAAI